MYRVHIKIREIEIETNIKVDVQKYWDFFLQISRIYYFILQQMVKLYKKETECMVKNHFIL